MIDKTQREMIEEIKKLKKQQNAVVVAHNYQADEVQEVADMVGDSLALSRYCANNSADIVVFCGVEFMAESAKILSPTKTVLLPERNAGCPMADMVTSEALQEKKGEIPDAIVICYINSSAVVKAESDICCTSSNAIKVAKTVKQDKIIFVPDQNLGYYVAQNVPEKQIILWEGFCATHHKVRAEQVEKIREAHPDAVLLVHPECRPEVVEKADFVGSTKQIIDYARSSDKIKFIVGTEAGILYSLKKENPQKIFYLMAPGLICPDMKKTSLNSVYTALKEMKYQININEEIRLKAKGCLERMLEIGL